MVAVTSSFDATADQLEQAPKAARIKKVLFCLAHNRWENDKDQLSRHSTPELLRQVLHLWPSLDVLRQALAAILQTINKPGEYTEVANTILQNLAGLYAEENSAPLEVGASGGICARLPKDLFSVRQAIISQTNPLRVKILLLQALQPELVGGDHFWSTLTSLELDDLLRRTLMTFSGAIDLEGRLIAIAQGLDEADEYIQAEGVTVEALAPVFAQLTSAAENSMGGPTWVESILPPPELEAEDDPEDIPLEVSSVDAPAMVGQALPSQPPPPSLAASPVAPPGARISDLLKYELYMEGDIKQLVETASSHVVTYMETTFHDLEDALEQRLQYIDNSEHLNLKYQTLRGFVSHIQGVAGRFMDILGRLEAADRQRLTTSDPPAR